MKALILTAVIGTCALSNELPSSSTAEQVKKVDSLSLVEKERLFYIQAQGLEALGKIHNEGLANRGVQYWIAVVSSTVLAADERFTEKQKSFINEFNQLAAATVKQLQQYGEERKGMRETNLLIQQFFDQIDAMMEKHPDCEQLLVQSAVANDFMVKQTGIMELIQKAEEKRVKGKLKGAALGKIYIDTAKKIRARIKELKR